MPSRNVDSTRTDEASSSGKYCTLQSGCLHVSVWDRLLTGSLGESRAPKRLQKTSANGEVPPRPSEPTPVSSIIPDPFPTPANRRRQSSIREHRTVQPLNSLQASPSKRYVRQILAPRKLSIYTLLIHLGSSTMVFPILRLRNEASGPTFHQSPILDSPLSIIVQDSVSPRQLQPVREKRRILLDPSISSLP